MLYFIVKNGNPRHVWNWRHRLIAFDMDADYSSRGWFSRSRGAAARRYQALVYAYPSSRFDVLTVAQYQKLWDDQREGVEVTLPKET